jgi:regulator of sigma E protease
MEVFVGLWTYVLPFLIVLTVLVFVHELGHYWVARRCGVRIETFSIGFGPELFGWHDRAGTRWKLSAIPLGGYVKFFGDADAMSTPGGELPVMSPEEQKVSFHHKPLGQRAAIVAAGPIANFAFAIIVSAVLFVLIGQPVTPSVVGGVVAGSAAEKAGFQAGDRIVRINGEQISRFEDIQRIVQLDLDQQLNVTVQRNGQEVDLVAVPEIVEETDRLGNHVRIPRLGIRGGGTEFVQRAPGAALWLAVVDTYSQTTGTLKALGQMVTGHRGSEDIGGPLRIAQMSGEVAKGGIANLFAFMAFLSINLGLINLFPVPVLDGGHLLFYLFEAVRGRPLGARAQEYGFRIGMVLVFSLMILATWNDLVHIGFVQRLVGWVS